MKHMGRVTGIISALIIPLLFSGQVFAATQSIAVEITVTAVVPSHRDIILDNAGRIVEIDSNTKEDVMPDVYAGSAAPENKRPLTSSLYTEYRQYVPEGTARYGVLYKRPAVLQALKPSYPFAEPKQFADAGFFAKLLSS